MFIFGVFRYQVEFLDKWTECVILLTCFSNYCFPKDHKSLIDIGDFDKNAYTIY